MTQSVDVLVDRDAALRESSASVGDVLPIDKIENLPMVGNNVLDLLNMLPGLRLSAAGEQFNTINGLGLNSINATRDGMSTNDTRFYPEFWGPRTLSTTNISPDLVGEIRLIVSPVDAEIGRGNAQVQISTRSGTNRYSGSASWNIRNSALDANTWTNNHTAYTDPISGVLYNSTPKNWSNLHEYSIAYGGPVRIPGVYNGTNKTFFYALWDQNIRNTRDSVNVNVLTDTARQGIFRYWEGYNPLGWNPSATNANPTFPLTATTASYIAVDQRGEPVRPPAAPNSSSINPSAPGFVPYSGNLRCFSVFGTMRLDGDGNMVPFTDADCPGGVIGSPTGREAWDNFRPTFDTSGLIRKFLLATPRANYFGAGDGLNTAQLRWVRGRSGEQNLGTNGLPTTIAGASNVGSSSFANRKQINIKIDHNFNPLHKVAVSYTMQKDDNADNCSNYPGGLCGATTRRPHVLTVNGTSTINPQMVNEARFGLNYTKNYTFAPWYSSNEEVASAAREYMLPAAGSAQNPGYTYLALVNSGIGNISTANGFINTGSAQVFAENVLYNWADTLSWSTGKHAFKFGVDWRLPRTTGNGSQVPDPQVSLGNASATATPSPFSTASNFNTPTDPVGYLPGLLNAAPGGVTAARTNVTNLLYYLYGSVGGGAGGGVNQAYWITSSANQTEGYWDDVSTQGQRLRKQISQEFAVFVKDDYKITNRLTLNLGVRWEYYSSPHIAGGFTTTMTDYGWGAFGATRAAQTTLDQFNADPFSIFLRPGNLYLTGYGTSATNPLSCETGVQQNQNPLLPVSTCDPNALSVIKFVGPDSPNPNIKAMPENYNNFGPAVGFAYQLPWFGEGKTTIRGGYQQTFGAAGVNRSAGIGGVEGIIANAPGATTTGTLTSNINNPAYQSILATRAIGLRDIQSLVPMTPNQLTPGTPVHVYGRSFAPQVYDPNLLTPYTQNITLSVTRQINRQFTVDMRYTGTLGRKQLGSFNINQSNVYNNPELFQALTDARAVTCTANAPAYKENYTDKGINPCNINGDPVFLDQMLAGLNLNTGVTGFGAVGTVNSGIFQSGAQHLRRNTVFDDDLAEGNFEDVADSLIALAPTAAQGRQTPPTAPPGTSLGVIALTGLRNGCDRIANGFSIVQQTTPGGAPVANSGAPIPLRCFPEDFLAANPQFSGVTYNTNTGRTNYHALQVQLTARPISGVNVQTTWIWAKSMFLPAAGYIDPSNRNLNYTVQAINPHSIRMNGTIELPMGPNKLLFGNTTGWVARILERWQTSFIFNGATGTPTTFNPNVSHLYAASGYDVASAKWKIPKAHVTWNEGATTGTMYPGNPYMDVPDPQCTNSSVVGAADRMGTNLQSVCELEALAVRNPDGTPGELLLAYPMPGKTGSLGRGNIHYFGQWSLDMNASKSFQIRESMSLQIRMDATNVLNHPTPNFPTLQADGLGTITGKGNQVREFQGTVRLNF